MENNDDKILKSVIEETKNIRQGKMIEELNNIYDLRQKQQQVIKSKEDIEK